MNDVQSETVQNLDFRSRSDRSQFLWWWRWFWRVALVVSLPYAWYCFYVPANSVAWADNFASAQERAAESGKPMILYFTGEWCVPCRIMKRNVWADPQVAASVNATFVPVMIDVNGPDAAIALSRYKVGVTPTTIITNSDGTVVQQKQGGMGKGDFLKLIEMRKSSAENDR